MKEDLEMRLRHLSLRFRARDWHLSLTVLLKETVNLQKLVVVIRKIAVSSTTNLNLKLEVAVPLILIS